MINPLPRRAAGLVLILGLLSAAPAPGGWPGISSGHFELVSDTEGYRLKPLTGDLAQKPIPVPTDWLEPPEEVALDEHRYVPSFEYDAQVDAIAIGGGRLGLHLSSWAVQQSGSARAASGRDVFLILDPRTRELLPGGIELGVSKGRVRLGGCFAATHHRLLVGDIDNDRLLDVGVSREAVACEVDSPQTYHEAEEMARRKFLPEYRLEPVRWYVQGDAGWRLDPYFDGRLPATGFRELPLIGLVKSPVDMVLDLKRDEPTLGIDAGDTAFRMLEP